MRKELKQVRKMASDLRNDIFQSEDTVNALIDGIIYRIDTLLNQDEAEMVEKVARAMEGHSQPEREEWQALKRQAKAALRAVGMIRNA